MGATSAERSFETRLICTRCGMDTRPLDSGWHVLHVRLQSVAFGLYTACFFCFCFFNPCTSSDLRPVLRPLWHLDVLAEATGMLQRSVLQRHPGVFLLFVVGNTNQSRVKWCLCFGDLPWIHQTASRLSQDIHSQLRLLPQNSGNSAASGRKFVFASLPFSLSGQKKKETKKRKKHPQSMPVARSG